MNFAVSKNNRVNFKESKTRDKFLELVIKIKQTMEYEGDSDTDCNWCTWNNPQRISKGTGRFGNKRTSGDYPNYTDIKIGLNTEKSPGHLKRFAVIQSPRKSRQLTLV